MSSYTVIAYLPKSTVYTKENYVKDYLKTHKQCSFKQLLEKQHSKMEVIVTFLIILEMMKTGKITISQEHIFDDILIESNCVEA